MRLSRSASAVLGACLLFAATAAAPRCAANPDDDATFNPACYEIEGTPEQASVHGKYATLLRRIHCPEDLPSYNHFTDYGTYTGTSWHAYTNLPPGYWVYVYPDWYIWRDCTETPGKIVVGKKKKGA